MPEVHQTSNCGIYEIAGIRDFEWDDPRSVREFLLDLSYELQVNQENTGHNWKWPGYLIFSDAKASRSHKITAGERLADYIMEHNLGEVTWSSWKCNPNTGNKIKMWMWSPNARRCEALLTKLRREQ